jgi:hypothetical protein
LFVITGPQGGGGSFNFTAVIDRHTEYVTWLLTLMRDRNVDVVDVDAESENEYARHCAEVDIASAPLRDCLSYFNHDGNAKPGSLAYYGGAKGWNKRRDDAQQSLAPYSFEQRDGGPPTSRLETHAGTE